ncbi:acyl-CoA thioesterase [Aspergillus fischeri NRRL 181]|uniref:Thioesterase family protein n=1 Tax=Neosartorya fischeri (strain ATCC 1020 / DSM 3700 / CBS 544.65 / FGSC A1164 / JCM 1740 / NRRL 181 / WB 181) TaxID=331117 RepID=A1DIJ6_NEOFI|nr:thioesterase family protein [Aspergillus fischeri NRRL 181]EAW19203.1 thioesterase family protein [Aspergillus fischeri NRRL 181]
MASTHPLHHYLPLMKARFDNDMYAHLNNTVYAMLFDSIVNSWLIAECGMDPFNRNKLTTSTGTSDDDSAVSQQVGIMVNSYCDYFASVSYPDVLDLGLRVARLGSSSVTYEVGVFRRGEEDVKVVGGYTHVFCARETMRPAEGGMEERVRRGLERLVVREGAKL